MRQRTWFRTTLSSIGDAVIATDPEAGDVSEPQRGEDDRLEFGGDAPAVTVCSSFRRWR